VPDAEVTRVLAPAVARAAEVKAQPLGLRLDTPVRIGRAAESPLGNLFTDALLATTPEATVALNNTFGGLRRDLPAGLLTYGRLYEVFPFDNVIVRVSLSGRQLRQVLTRQLSQRLPAGVGGIRVEARCQDGRPEVTLRRPSGTTIPDDERVEVATTDFLAAGGGGMLAGVMPDGGFPLPDAAPVARDAVAEYFKRRGGHVSEASLLAGPPRWDVDGGLPLACAGR
jgi:2',3'-cyclic-nucleotide 2'-phosphodiesterase (5'-nucleotidase family)